MIRRVIVDLMMALFATIFAIAIVSPENKGQQPKSQNFILLVTEEKNNDSGPRVEFTAPDPNVAKEVSIKEGYPTSDDKLPRIYLVFPAMPGEWKITSTEELDVDVSTRSRRQQMRLAPHPGSATVKVLE